MAIKKEDVVKDLYGLFNKIQEEIEYNYPVPCPDGLRGCEVYHFVKLKRSKNLQEIMADFKLFIEAINVIYHD